MVTRFCLEAGRNRARHAAIGLVLAVLCSAAVESTDMVNLDDVDVLPAVATYWVARLHLSDAGFEASGVELDGTRFFVDLKPVTWSGSSIQRESEGGVIAYRWAQFTAAPPTVRFVVEHQPGWQCTTETKGATVEVNCRIGSVTARQTVTGPTQSAEKKETAAAEPRGCQLIALARDLGLCTPLRGFSGADILAHSLEYLPKDVIRDGLPHFGAVRDDWKGKPRPHKGLDIYVDECDVLAMASGEVVGIGRGERAGGWIKVSHNSGVGTFYIHVRHIFVDVGETVSAGQRIGRVSGPVGNAVEAQLHLEIKIDGTSVDPAPIFKDASQADLRRAWQRAISSIPQKVGERERELEAQQAQRTN